MDRAELEGADRESLVVRAQAAGIRRARILTRPELIDELLRLDPSTDEAQLRKSRGFFGRARDLVARVVERGLHLPDAAERIRTTLAGGADLPFAVPRSEPQAMPTVTLAEIYAAQGHRKRAIETLRRVLLREPEHVAAQSLLARLEDEKYVAPPPPLPPEPDIEPELNPPDDEPSDDASIDTPSPLAPAARFEGGVAGPSCDDSGGAEFYLAPASERLAEDEPRSEDPADAPTRELGVVAAPAELEEPDQCFAVPLQVRIRGAVGGPDEGGSRMYVRWRVSYTAIGAQLAVRPQGHFVVRAYVVTPSWDGPLTETRDRVIDPDADELMLEDLPERAVVRVAVGWLDPETFVPFAHSPALELMQASGRTSLSIWTPQGSVRVVLNDPRSAPIARAFDRSRHAAEARG